ncbi:MAG: MFS transporter [Candidatus Lokiarchaeota archaeon]|nr:MFS transporter [Candidatus Lokiarchaeota archaeon]MBD3341142.1 MFS transporter [Candidatus Lokiarchaeota archaeon]
METTNNNSKFQNSKKINLQTNRLLRYSIFGIIYLHQGFIEVFMYVYMALYLIRYNVNLALIGLTIAIGTAPWIFKIFYGILSDRKKIGNWGRRLPYMIIGSFFSALLFFMLIPVNPNAGWLIFAGLIFAANFFNALCDTSTDGLVVDTTTPEKRGTAQSVCWGSKFGGYVIAAIMVGFFVEIFSWALYFLFMGIFLLVSLPFLFISREPPFELSEKFPWKDVKDTFKKRIVIIISLLFIFSEMGLYITLSMLPLYLSLDLGLSIEYVGIIMALGSGGFVVGCAISGPILDRFSRRLSISISLVFLSVMIIIVALIQNLLDALIFVFLAGIAWGFLQIAEMILSMDICKKSISATMFSVYMSILNLGIIIGTGLSGLLVELVGFRMTFIIASLIVLSNLILASLIKDTEDLFCEENEATLLKN